MTKIVEINCLEHIYPDKTKVEICGVEFTVEKGEKIAVLGENGAGKSTILKHITGLLEPSKGTVLVFGENPHKNFNKISMKIGTVLQNVDEQLIGATVLEDIMFAPLNYGFSKNEAEQKAVKIMETLNILHLKDKVIHYLSGGEKRKVAIAGALVLEPELLVLDEPFTGLDKKSQNSLVNLLNKICSEKSMSLVVSTHDVEVVAEFADTMYLISNHKVSTKGVIADLLTNTELLQEYNLEPPSIVKLFKKLNLENFDKLPLTVDEAVEILKR
ncbi:MAG: energy-coupling factor ABC transporter ATP-binding protein [Candidatus Gastranaerophilales bacterium]|nr:energy-coupling factor ABC transporter ATP-binding protein [Candidatus Gastranaerophilales bacterium]